MEAAPSVIARNLLARYESRHMRDDYGAGTAPVLGGRDCPAWGTNSMSYKKSVLDVVGGFDETFPYAAAEDTDLKWRVADRGWQLLYVPVRVVHDRPYTLASFWRQHITRGRGVVHFERKHYGGPPTRLRVLLRAGIRTFRWPPSILRMGPGVATVKYLAELADALGQWLELGEISGQ